MTTCPQCGRPLLPCCGNCPKLGHDARCQSEEARAILAKLAKQALADLLEREAGK